MVRKSSSVSFEKALSEFEALVEKMEQGELSLEDSLKHYERGITLSRVCQAALEAAEQRIQVLNESTGELEEPPSTNDDD